MFLAVAILLMGAAASRASVTPGEALVLADRAPKVLGVAADTIEITTAGVVDILHLPLGVVEIALSPLPGITMKKGFQHLGTGLAGPFKFVGRAIQLPSRALKAVAGSDLKDLNL